MAEFTGGSIGGATIEVRVAMGKFKSDLRECERALRQSSEGMGRSATRAESALNNVGVKFRRDMLASTAAVNQLNGSLATTQRLATAALAGAGSFAAAAAVVRLADQYTNLSARIRLVIDESENFEEVQERIFRAAQATRAPVEDLTNLYVRLRQSIAGLGDAEALNISQTLARTLAISGAGQSETAAFLRQISQALASGVLRGDEFNSVMENNSRFAGLLAEQLGVSVGHLRGMAEQGQLTADVIRAAIAGGSGSLADEFERMPLTIAGAYRQLENALARYVGQTDQGAGASQRMAQGIAALANNFETLADAMTIVGAAAVGSLAGRGVAAGQRGIGAFIGDAWANSGAGLTRLQQQAFAVNDTLEKIHTARMVSMAQLDEIIREETSIRQAAEHWRREVAAQAQADLGPNAGSRIGASQGTRRAGPAVGEGEFEERRNATQRLADAEHELARIQGQRIRIEDELDHANRNLIGQNEKLAQTVAQIDRRMTVGSVAMRGFLTSMVAIRGAASSLVGFLGGPWGVALTAASVAFVLFRSRADQARASLQSIETGLQIVANAGPAFEGAANAIGETADQTRTMEEVTRDAADAARDLANANRDSAAAANINQRAQAALALVQQQQAIAQLAASAAAARKRREDMLSYSVLEGVTDFVTGDFIGDRGGRRTYRREDLEQLNREITLLDEGLEAFRSGLLIPNGRQSEAASALPDARSLVGGADRSLQKRIQDLREFIRLGGDVQEAMRRAAAFGGTDATEAISSLLDMPEALGDANLVADPLLRFTVTLERLNDLKTAAGGAGGPLFDRAIVESILEMNRAATNGADAFSALDAAVRDGLVSAELADRARSSIRALGDDYDRARRIIEGGRSELQNVRREIAEVQRLTAAGIFGEVGSENAEGEAMVQLLERMARAAGSAAEALAILDGVQLPKDVARGDAERRVREAAREGVFDREERNGEWWRREDLRDSVADALEDGFSTGGWREAFRDGLDSVVNNMIRRMSESLANAVIDAMNSSGSGGGGKSGGGGFWGNLFSNIAQAWFGGARANGGDVQAGKGYMVGENGPEPFFPGVSGSIGTNKAMREAVSNGNRGEQRLVVEARIDQGIDLKIAAAKQEAMVGGARLGVEMITTAIRNKQSV